MSETMVKRGKPAPKAEINREPTPEERAEERQHLLKVAEDMRARMEAESLRVRDLILAQPPLELLGYLWAQLHMSILAEQRQKDEDEYRPNKDLIQKFQLALEYAHAVWSANTSLLDTKNPLDEAKAGQLFEVLDELKNATMDYCMASSAASIEGEGARQSAETEFHAKTSWALIRGNRYQVLE
ncbi:MAG TPA: hypothetical protein VMU78_01095, partial [Methylocella sp.]|nr:hypothetical protein [Methylocella sp.]